MGKCETSSISIGIKILLSDLVLQINEKNFDLIKEMLNDGFISDSNEHYNDAYTEIIWCMDLPKDYLEYKAFLEKEFKNKGSYLHLRNSNKIEPDLRNGCLFERELLLPIKKVMETERFVFLVLEYAPKGELLEYIVKNVKLDEGEARRIMKQIISAIVFLCTYKVGILP
jgi:serine/threonine protein kinase